MLPQLERKLKNKQKHTVTSEYCSINERKEVQHSYGEFVGA
jgi:hypothetical protein